MLDDSLLRLLLYAEAATQYQHKRTPKCQLCCFAAGLPVALHQQRQQQHQRHQQLQQQQQHLREQRPADHHKAAFLGGVQMLPEVKL